MRYRITVEFDAEYVPSEVMNDLADTMLVQLESLNDGTLDSAVELGPFDYKLAELSWSNEEKE